MLGVNDIADNGQMVATWSDPHNPTDIVALNAAAPNEIARITNVNSDEFEYIELGEVEEIWYESVDGKKVQGWIVKPPDFDASKKYPLVLRIHGGPHSMYHVGFNYNFQLHAAQDQVVLYTNPRGSTGYGYDFANAIQNNYPGDDYHDLMKCVDEVIARGYIDYNKMYVYGGSGGGVLTSWIVVQTDRILTSIVVAKLVAIHLQLTIHRNIVGGVSMFNEKSIFHRMMNHIVAHFPVIEDLPIHGSEKLES